MGLDFVDENNASLHFRKNYGIFPNILNWRRDGGTWFLLMKTKFHNIFKNIFPNILNSRSPNCRDGGTWSHNVFLSRPLENIPITQMPKLQFDPQTVKCIDSWESSSNVLKHTPVVMCAWGKIRKIFFLSIVEIFVTRMVYERNASYMS